MGFVGRLIQDKLEEALEWSRVVMLHGARQCGKTTLAQAIVDQRGGTYVSLDDPAQLQLARADPLSYLANQRHPLAVDEIQLGGDELVRAVKQLVDAERTPGRFLLTGSTNFLTVPTISESLLEGDLVAWASSGAMALTGPRGGAPSEVPSGVAAAMVAAADDLAGQSAGWGSAVAVDGPALLGERAAFTGMERNGDTSVGGSARFMRAADGWVVLNLPRPEDIESLPALVGQSLDADDWSAIAAGIASLNGAHLVETATLLGIPAAVPSNCPLPVDTPERVLHRGGPRTVVERPLVVDLTSLWAGPLTGGLLAEAGARVVKVEGAGRPDGARRGTPEFFNLLNHAKECVQVDFADAGDTAFLRRLLRAADLVLEGSRPRVMEQLGIDPVELADAGVCWLSINAYGRTGDAAMRVGFGDDTAVAGGLWLGGDPPSFVADAVADPIAGLAAAAVGARLLAGEQAAVVEVPLARAAAWAHSKPRPASVDAPVRRDGDRWLVQVRAEWLSVAPPRHRAVTAEAAAVGSHDAPLRAEFAPSAVGAPQA